MAVKPQDVARALLGRLDEAGLYVDRARVLVDEVFTKAEKALEVVSEVLEEHAGEAEATEEKPKDLTRADKEAYIRGEYERRFDIHLAEDAFSLQTEEGVDQLYATYKDWADTEK